MMPVRENTKAKLLHRGYKRSSRQQRRVHHGQCSMRKGSRAIPIFGRSLSIRMLCDLMSKCATFLCSCRKIIPAMMPALYQQNSRPPRFKSFSVWASQTYDVGSTVYEWVVSHGALLQTYATDRRVSTAKPLAWWPSST